MFTIPARDLLRRQNLIFRIEGGQLQVEPSSGVRPRLFCFDGFCDLQVNGAFGVDFNAPALTQAGIRAVCEEMLRQGVTAFLPTIITAPREHILHQFAVLESARRNDKLIAACIPGYHLEGPYLSPLEGARGAHEAAFIRPPDWEEFLQFQQAAGGHIRIVTLAPEVQGAVAFIAQLSAAGIIPAIGHTLAGAEDIQKAAEAGAKLSTHLGNGIPALINRHDNPFLHQLVCDELSAGVIFDGHHLPPAMRALLKRVKGVERLILVSDATRLTGLPPGRYAEAVGGEVELSADGRLSLAGTPYLAGAARTLKENAELALGDPGTRVFNTRLRDVLRMAGENPRRMLGLTTDSRVVFALTAGRTQFSMVLTAIDGCIYHQDSLLFEEKHP